MKGQDPRGISLAEVLVVMALLAVLLLTVLPQLSVPSQVPVAEAARQVAADAGLARRLAIAGRTPYVVTFSPAGGPYTSYAVAPQGGTPGADFPKTFPQGITVAGAGQIAFLPSGAAAAGATLSFTRGTVTAQVQVTAATGFVQVVGP